MKTTKAERTCWRSTNILHNNTAEKDAEAALLDDVDELLENVTNIALAAGLPATATPAEVVARVGEMWTHLDKESVDVAADRTWCRLCRTERTTVLGVGFLGRDTHPHDPSCVLSRRILASEAGR